MGWTNADHDTRLLGGLVGGAVEWRYGVDILAADESTPLENPLVYDQNASDRLVPQSSSVALDVHAKSHRSVTMTLRSSDGRYLVGVAGQPSGGAGSPTATGLVWYNARYRPWIDLLTGFDPTTGAKVYERTPLGIFVLTEPETQVKNTGAMTVLNLMDKSNLLCAPFLITNSTLPTFVKSGTTVGGYASGSTFDSVMADLASRFGVPANRQNFEASALTLPDDYTIIEGSEPWTHLQALAAAMAHVIYFDSRGYLVRRSDPMNVNAPSVYTFTPGPTSIISALTRKTTLASTYNHVIVIGGSSTTSTFRGEATVATRPAPTTATPSGDRFVYVGKDGKLNDMTPDPLIGSTAQANTRASQLLARYIGQQESITIQARNLPLDPYDRITANVADAGLALDFSLDKITWNLAHSSGGGMALECSRWFAIGFVDTARPPDARERNTRPWHATAPATSSRPPQRSAGRPS